MGFEGGIEVLEKLSKKIFVTVFCANEKLNSKC
jgi:hypothetical protein